MAAELRHPSVAASIGGWPTEIRRFDLGAAVLDLVAVARLESLLDRSRLLADASYEPPYWALVWSGAPLLARWVARRHQLAGTRFLDVGCGLGLVGLMAARLGARVTAVDRDATALAFVRESAAYAGLEVETVEGDVADVLRAEPFDVVAAAEVLYERSAFDRLARVLGECLDPAGRLYMADARRVDTRSFYDILVREGWGRVEQWVETIDEEGTTVRVELSSFARASSYGPGRER